MCKLLEIFQKFTNYLQKVNNIAENFWTDVTTADQKLKCISSFRDPKEAWHTSLESLRSLLQVSHRTFSQILTATSSKTELNNLCTKLQTVQTCQIVAGITLKPKLIMR
jgi:conjugal transfer/entry exclusion protein